MAPQDDFEEMDALLPFYVNGTLGADDRARLDAALTVSPGLRAALLAEEGFAQRIRIEGEKLMDGHKDVEARLKAVLGQLGDQAPNASVAAVAPEAGSRLRDMLGFLNPGRWHPAVSLALALAVIAQGAWIASGKGGGQGDDYQTVSGPDGQNLGEAPMLIIRPAEDARWSDIEALLEKEDLTLASGPDDGRLTVRVDKADVDLAALANRLRAAPGIAFVGEVK